MVAPVIGGYVSDSLTGKVNAVLGGGLIYLLGLFLLPASAADYSTWFGREGETSFDLSVATRKLYYFLGLGFIVVGCAGVKANIGPLGAQQVEHLGSEAVQTFFNWLYWFINVGFCLAYSAVAYIQQNLGFQYGYLVSLLSMLVCALIYVVLKYKCGYRPPEGSILKDIFGVCCATKCKGFKYARKSGKYSSDLVDGVVAVLNVLPIYGLLIIYWAVYSQMSTTFYLQTERLNIQVGKVNLPVAALNIFNTLIILILIPIMDRIVYPFLTKYNKKPTQLQRIGVGMVFAALSVVTAGVLEIYRKEEISNYGGRKQILDGAVFSASSLSMFLQVPQFLLMGISEVFFSISALEFAYSQAPESMQGVVFGLNLMVGGLGNYAAELILKIVEKATYNDPWFPDEINNGHADYVFFIFGGLMMLNLFIYILVARRYKYRCNVTGDDHVTSDNMEDKSHDNSSNLGMINAFEINDFDM